MIGQHVDHKGIVTFASVASFVCTAIALPASIAAAQPPAGGGGQRGGGQPPAPMTNLQIIPKDTPRQQVIATMQQFTQVRAKAITMARKHEEAPASSNI